MAEKKKPAPKKTVPTADDTLRDTPVKKSPIVKQAAQKPIKGRTVVLERGKVIAEVGESQVKDFINFIRTQGVVGLAVGLVLGGAVTVMVKSLVDNVVMPPLGFLLGSSDGLKGLSWNMGKTHGGQNAILHYGVFLNDLINFIVIALVVYMIVHLFKFDRLDKKKE
jgi:large conductance mechanosensitive channel